MPHQNHQKNSKKNLTQKKLGGRKLRGVIVSTKMAKTAVVRVTAIKYHPTYQKRYKVHKKHHAHDEKGEHKEGENVIIQECPPISKTKRWKIVEKKSK